MTTPDPTAPAPVPPTDTDDAPGAAAGAVYACRDIESLGEHYARHVEAMTAEGLHAKSAIAAELAHRDAAIAVLTAERDALRTAVATLPKTRDGVPITPGMTVWCRVGERADERKVVGPYGQKALLTREPARHGTCEGDSHRLANTVYSTRDAALSPATDPRAGADATGGGASQILHDKFYAGQPPERLAQRDAAIREQQDEDATGGWVMDGSHSPTVTIHLDCGPYGSVPLARVTPRCVVAKTEHVIPPCDAELVVNVGGEVTRQAVRLTSGFRRGRLAGRVILPTGGG
jgi:hypothetical protein